MKKISQILREDIYCTVITIPLLLLIYLVSDISRMSHETRVSFLLLFGSIGNAIALTFRSMRSNALLIGGGKWIFVSTFNRNTTSENTSYKFARYIKLRDKIICANAFARRSRLEIMLGEFSEKNEFGKTILRDEFFYEAAGQSTEKVFLAR